MEALVSVGAPRRHLVRGVGGGDIPLEGAGFEPGCFWLNLTPEWMRRRNTVDTYLRGWFISTKEGGTRALCNAIDAHTHHQPAGGTAPTSRTARTTRQQTRS